MTQTAIAETESKISHFSHGQVIPHSEFNRAFKEMTSHRPNEVLFQSMQFEPGPMVDEFTEALIEMATSGVKILGNIDGYRGMVVDEKYRGKMKLELHPRERELNRILIENQERQLQTLRDAGIRISETNLPNLLTQWLPMYGRNHRKLNAAIGKNKIAMVGDANYSDHVLGSIGFSVLIENGEIVERLQQVFEADFHHRPVPDIRIRCDDSNTLVVDQGRVGRSAIQENFVEIVQQAQKNILLMSPWYPFGKEAQALRDASDIRNVDVNFITNQPPIRGDINLSHKLGLLGGNFDSLNISHTPSFLHGRMLVADYGDPDRQIAMFGSSGMTTALARYAGTAELNLKTKEQTIIDNLVRYYYQTWNDSCTDPV